jgi:hypothetical protein
MIYRPPNSAGSACLKLKRYVPKRLPKKTIEKTYEKAIGED